MSPRTQENQKQLFGEGKKKWCPTFSEEKAELYFQFIFWEESTSRGCLFTATPFPLLSRRTGGVVSLEFRHFSDERRKFLGKDCPSGNIIFSRETFICATEAVFVQKKKKSTETIISCERFHSNYLPQYRHRPTLSHRDRGGKKPERREVDIS